MGIKIKPVYKCSEDTLYEVTRRATANLKEDRLDFFAKSTNYTLLHVTGLEGLRTAAMGLPNEEQRNAFHEGTRKLLPGLMEPVKLNFRALQGYIRDGWPNEDVKPRYEAAGLLKYNLIRQSNWEAVVGLQTMMLAFVAVADNLTKLNAPGGMPAGFVAQLGTDYVLFETQLNLFASTVDTTTARNAKVTANNKLTTEVKKFMKFGREVVYAKNDGKKERYAWEIIVKQVDGGMAGLHVKTMNGVLDVPEAEAECTWKPEGKEASTWLTAKTGIGKKVLEEGEGVLTVKKAGFKLVTKMLKIEAGVKKRVKVVLEPE
jgi:hypothetical protein